MAQDNVCAVDRLALARSTSMLVRVQSIENTAPDQSIMSFVQYYKIFRSIS